MMKKLLWLTLCLTLCCVMAGAAEEISFDLEPGCEFGGMLTLTYLDGTTEETGAYGFGMEDAPADMTIGEVLAYFDIAAVEPVREDDTFEGWMVFTLNTTVDEDGFEDWSYVQVGDGLYSTEDLLALPAPDYYAIYTAKWAGVAEEDYYAATDDYVEVIMSSITLFSGEGMMLLHGEEEDYTATMSVATVEDGQTFGEALELDSLLDVTAEGKTFTGWTVYDVYAMTSDFEPVTDEGVLCIQVFEDWYVMLEEYSVCAEMVSTQELAEMVCGVTDHVIVANFE